MMTIGMLPTVLAAVVAIVLAMAILRGVRDETGDLTEGIAVAVFGAVVGHFFGIFPMLGSLLTTTPVLRWQNIIGIMAASYTVAGQLGIPSEAVTAGGVALVLLFGYKVLFRSYEGVAARRSGSS